MIKNLLWTTKSGNQQSFGTNRRFLYEEASSSNFSWYERTKQLAGSSL